MKKETKKALFCFFSVNLLLLVLGLGFLALDRLSVWDRLVICPLHFLGLYCPTCGMTRAAHALLRLDLAAAFALHPLIYLLLGVVVYYEVAALLALGKRRRISRLPAYLFLAALFLYFIVRNILLLTVGLDPLGDFIA